MKFKMKMLDFKGALFQTFGFVVIALLVGMIANALGITAYLAAPIKDLVLPVIAGLYVTELFVKALREVVGF